MVGKYKVIALCGSTRFKDQFLEAQKNLLIEEYPQAEKAIVRDGNVWILDTVVNDFAGITRFYAGLMHEIKVLEGEAFLEYVREYLKRFVNKI